MAGTYTYAYVHKKKSPGTEKHRDKQKTLWRRYVTMATPIAIKPKS